MIKKVLAGIFMAAVIAVFAVGCSSGSTTPTTSTPSVSPASTQTTPTQQTTQATATRQTSGATATQTTGAYSVKVYLDGTLVKALTMDDIKSLPVVTFSTEGKDESGPSVLSAFKMIGITDFSQFTAYGLSKGRLADAQLTLTRAQVTDQVILDITNKGTVKLASSNLSSDNWVIDVNTIKVTK